MSKPAPTAPLSNSSPANQLWFVWILVCLLGVLGILFFPSFKSEQVLFANDGPLGANNAQAMALPSAFHGIWHDLNWLGAWSGSALPTITYTLAWFLKPLGFAKFYAPLCLFILGASVWLFFRQLGFASVVCVLGGLAAALNMDFFSYACWGLGTLPLCVASNFLALAAFVGRGSLWARLPLAGFGVGMGIMEGFDNGAIFSLCVASFVVAHSCFATGKPSFKLAVGGVAKVIIVALCAAFLAAQALTTLTGTQIQGIVGTKQDKETRAQNWAFATQVSFPKIETLRLFIPGLFGYGMPAMYGQADEAYGGANYWGAVGQDQQWENYFRAPAASRNPNQAPTRATLRFSGAGPYAGVLVVLVAAFALVHSFRKRDNLYSSADQNLIKFWATLALASLLLAYGRYAPFYQLLYSLPYFSTIRVPYKWLHPFSLSLVILFGYGLQGMFQRFIARGETSSKGMKEQLSAWWAKAPAFDKKWTLGALAFFAASVAGWLIYGSSRKELERHLQEVFFPPDLAKAIAAYSLHDVGIYVFLLAVSIALVALILSGWFGGARAKWAGIALGALLVVDLGRANLPWIVHYDYQKKYATNPVIDLLREKPFEHRVTHAVPFALPAQMPRDVATHVQHFKSFIYYQDWLQNLFPFYNVQSIDIIQMPRAPEDIAAFQRALAGAPRRLWELTNTRYLVDWAGFVEPLNNVLDPAERRFRVQTYFELHQASADSPITIRTNTTGPLALMEFTGALPRAKLYSNWRVEPDLENTLKQLASTNFNPAQSVFVADSIQPPAGATNAEPGTVEFKAYAPKRIQLEADARQPSVLLLNDRFEPQWQVFVDGKRETLLRCNFTMRGVLLAPGKHRVEFRFVPSNTSFYISLAAVALALAMCGFLAFSRDSAAVGESSVPMNKPASSAPSRKTK
ncbi:MAG: hypothetical protein HY043_19820 [Verrucomicrobia bacterium]|nr:hypothetical protein [Verrucomicrobiota bacterium]